MDIRAIYGKYSREELENMIMSRDHEILQLEDIILNCGEELVKMGCGNTELLKVVESNYKSRWNYPQGYSMGTFNQMRLYISELENLLGRDAALKIRSNKCKYLSDWFDITEPDE